MVYALDLKSNGIGHVGSNPSDNTIWVDYTPKHPRKAEEGEAK